MILLLCGKGPAQCYLDYLDVGFCEQAKYKPTGVGDVGAVGSGSRRPHKEIRHLIGVHGNEYIGQTIMR